VLTVINKSNTVKDMLMNLELMDTVLLDDEWIRPVQFLVNDGVTEWRPQSHQSTHCFSLLDPFIQEQ
jgi:hypothetical protein